MEQAITDLLIEPAIIEAVLTHIFEFHYEHNRRIFEPAAARRPLLALPKNLARRTAAHQRRGVSAVLKPTRSAWPIGARKYNLKIIYHTDGVEFVPARSRDDVGIDVLIRSSGAAVHGAREPWGRIRRRIVFHALDNQQPAVGSAADVVDEVNQNLDIFRDGPMDLRPVSPDQP